MNKPEIRAAQFHPNALRRRQSGASRLSTESVHAEIEPVLHRLSSGELQFRPPLEPGAHEEDQEVRSLLMADLAKSVVSPTIPPSTRPSARPTGLSAKASHCLFRAGIPAEQRAVGRARQTGALVPVKRTVNYGTGTCAALVLIRPLTLCRRARNGVVGPHEQAHLGRKTLSAPGGKLDVPLYR